MRLDCAYGGEKPREAHDRDQNHVDVAQLHNVANGLLSGIDFHVLIGEHFLKLAVFAFIGYDNRIGLELARLSGKERGVAVCRQHFCREKVRMFLNYFQGLRAYRAG